MTPDNEGESGSGQGNEDTQASQRESRSTPEGETRPDSQEHIGLKEAQAGLQPYPPSGTENPAAPTDIRSHTAAGLQPYPPAGTENPAAPGEQSPAANTGEQGSPETAPPEASAPPPQQSTPPQDTSSGDD